MKILNQKFSFRYGVEEYKYNYVLEGGALHLDPLPQDHVIPHFYPKSYGNYNISPGRLYGKSKILLAKWKNAIKVEPTFKNFCLSGIAAFAEIVLGRRLTPSLGVPFSLPKNSRILDVGYGGGEYLLTLKEHGFTDLHGYDIEQNFHSQFLIDKGIKIYSSVFSDIGLADASVDLIRLEHVFEHLKNPEEYLQVCLRKLKPGGKLVMTFPTYHNPVFYLNPVKFPHLDTPRHIYLHNKQSTINYLKRTAFTDISCKYQPCFNVFLASFSWLKNRKISKGIEVVFGPLYLVVLSLFNMGEQINVIARKPTLPQ